MSVCLHCGSKENLKTVEFKDLEIISNTATLCEPCASGTKLTSMEFQLSDWTTIIETHFGAYCQSPDCNSKHEYRAVAQDCDSRIGVLYLALCPISKIIWIQTPIVWGKKL